MSRIETLGKVAWNPAKERRWKSYRWVARGIFCSSVLQLIILIVIRKSLRSDAPLLISLLMLLGAVVIELISGKVLRDMQANRPYHGSENLTPYEKHPPDTTTFQCACGRSLTFEDKPNDPHPLQPDELERTAFVCDCGRGHMRIRPRIAGQERERV